MTKLETKFDAFMLQQSERDKTIDSIHRALYGDKINQTDGLVAQQKNDEKEKYDRKIRDDKLDILLEGILKQEGKNTTFRKKITKALYISGGTVGLGGVGTATFWDNIKSLLGKLI